MTKTALMIDIESLDLGPKSIITQVGVIVFSVDDPETELRRIEVYLPVQPQVSLDRTFSWETMLWWMSQPEKARAHFIENSGNDMEELLALVRSGLHRKISDVIRQAGGRSNVEIWARGPQFDIVNLETLFADCGLTTPWSHDSVMDLRTTMRLAGVKSEDVDSTGIVQHVAIEDCKFQIRCYIEAMKNKS